MEKPLNKLFRGTSSLPQKSIFVLFKNAPAEVNNKAQGILTSLFLLQFKDVDCMFALHKLSPHCYDIGPLRRSHKDMLPKSAKSFLRNSLSTVDQMSLGCSRKYNTLRNAGRSCSKSQSVQIQTCAQLCVQVDADHKFLIINIVDISTARFV